MASHASTQPGQRGPAPAARRRPIDGFWFDSKTGEAGFDEPVWLANFDSAKRWRAIEDIARRIEELRMDELIEFACDKLREYPESTDDELEELFLDALDFGRSVRPSNVAMVLREARGRFLSRAKTTSAASSPTRQGA